MNDRRKILFIAANLETSSAADIAWLKEYKAMQNIFAQNGFQNSMYIEPHFNTTPDEFLNFTQGENIWLLHFCGHGNSNGKIILQDESDDVFAVRNRDFVNVLSDISGLKCVLFNACNSHILAEETQEIVDYVIGFDGVIHNDDAIEFIQRFYSSFLKVKTIPMAYRLATQGLSFKRSKNVSVVFKCRYSLIMKALISGKKLILEEKYAHSKSLQEELERIEGDKQHVEKMLVEVSKKGDELFWAAYEESPSPCWIGVNWFNDDREILAFDLAKHVMPSKSIEEKQEFADDMGMLFEYLCASLASVEVSFTQEDIQGVQLSFEKRYYTTALETLIGRVPKICSEEFLPYFIDNVHFIARAL
jgi:hypothetical protein